MDKIQNAKSLGFGIPGLVLRVAAPVLFILGEDSATANTLSPILWLAGTSLLLVGFHYYAKAIGRHGAWALAALFGLVGLVVLVCLRDNHAGPPPIGDPLRRCPNCGAPYRLGDYLDSAEHIYCTSCKTELDRSDPVNAGAPPT